MLNGFGANVYSQLAVATIQIAGVPILLHFWGLQRYGEWLILSAVPVYLAMADLGFAQSAANDMTQSMGKNDKSGALVVFQSIGILIALCSFFGFLGVGLLLQATPLVEMLPIHALTQSEAVWVLLFLASDVTVKLNDGTIHAGFRANGGYALHVSINATTTLAQNLGLWGVVAAGGGVVLAASCFVFVRVVAISVSAILITRRYPWLPIGVSQARLAVLKRLIGPAIANLSFPLAQGLSLQAMVLSVGAALGPIAVVAFSTLRTLSRLVFQAAMTVIHAVEPEMARAFGARNSALLHRLYVRTSQITIGLVGTVSLVLFFTKDWLIALWTHGAVVVDHSLFGWLMASVVVSAFWGVGLNVLKAANLHLSAALLFVFAAGSAVIFSYLLMKATNSLSSVGLALFVMDTLMAGYVVFSVRRIFCGLGHMPITSAAR